MKMVEQVPYTLAHDVADLRLLGGCNADFLQMQADSLTGQNAEGPTDCVLNGQVSFAIMSQRYEPFVQLCHHILSKRCKLHEQNLTFSVVSYNISRL